MHVISKSAAVLLGALVALGALGACWRSSSPDTGAGAAPPEPRPGAISVDLAAVTLADDCGDAGRPPPPPPPATITASKTSPAAAAPAEMAVPADMCEGCAPSQGACEQTSMQLAIRAGGATQPTTIRIKHVELLDEAGKLVERLAPRAPTQWSGDAYRPWQETVAPGQSLAASYRLSAPDYDGMSGGRWQAHTRRFQLRVTVVVGDAERTIEKLAIAPAMLEPPVPT